MLNLYGVLFFLFSISSFCLAADIAINEQEIIQNGNFEDGKNVQWFSNCSLNSRAAKDSAGGIASYQADNSNVTESIFLQVLTLPSQLDSASFSFDFRVISNNTTGASPAADIEVYIVKSKTLVYQQMPQFENLAFLHTERYTPPLDWQYIGGDIAAEVISAMQSANDAGEFVFLYFNIKSTGNNMTDPVVHIDNVSFNVTGTQKVPAMTGKIAYYEWFEKTAENESVERSIKILDPNHRSTKTVYTNSDLQPDLKWRPDGTEIAFVSKQEHIFNYFYGDIFAIKPDGTQLRKITNQPFQEEIVNGDYPRVTLTGSILNSTSFDSGTATMCVCPWGADHCIYPSINPGDTYEFSIPDVAVLDDPDVYTQYVVIYWYNNSCPSGLEAAIFNAPVINGTANLGTISFNASLCLEAPNSPDFYKPAFISWKKDASQIVGYNSHALQAWDSTSGLPFGGKELPSGGYRPYNMDWSPVDDRYIYTAYPEPGDYDDSIFLSQENGNHEMLIRDVSFTVPAWLPDGSGFIYVENGPVKSFLSEDTQSDNIYSYDLNSGSIQPLTFLGGEEIADVSVSPDGRYVIFTRCSKATKYSFWILDRQNPADMWQVMEPGFHRAPDWSRVEVEVDWNSDPDNAADPGIATGPDDAEDPDKTNTPPKNDESGGGCFIDIAARKDV